MTDREMTGATAHGIEMAEPGSDAEVALTNRLLDAADAVLQNFRQHSERDDPEVFRAVAATLAAGAACLAVIVQLLPESHRYVAVTVKGRDGSVVELGRLVPRPGGGGGLTRRH